MGLFGTFKQPMLPGMITGFGGGTFNSDGTQVTGGFGNRPSGIEEAAAYTGPAKKGGIFGSGVKWQQIAGILGDSLLAANGQGMPYTKSVLAQRQQENLLKRQAMEQQQELQRQIALAEWKRANPEQTDTQRNFEYYSGLDPAQRAQFDRMRAGDPYVTTTLPNKQIYSGPASGLGAALSGGVSSDDQPGEEDGYVYTPGPGGRGNQANWKLKGGPAGNGGGMFP